MIISCDYNSLEISLYDRVKTSIKFSWQKEGCLFAVFAKALETLIQLIKEASFADRHNLVPILYVLAGIKPVLVIEKFHKVTVNQIGNLALKLPNLSVAVDHEYCYIINENPLPEFDPRKFIKSFEFTSLKEAACWAFQNRSNPIAVQMLSYLLGYGPTWEAFHAQVPRPAPDKMIFSDEHYLSLGKAVQHGGTNSREEFISVGKMYSAEALKGNRPAYKFDTAEFSRLHSVYGGHIIAEIPYRTDYLQNSLRYKERLLESYGIKF